MASFWSGFAEVLNGLAAVMWPILAVIVLLKLFPILRAVIESRAFTIKVAGFEVSAQEASDQQRVILKDLQEKVAMLRKAFSESTKRTVAAEAASDARTSQARELPETGTSMTPESPGRILWVDDRPTNNAYEMSFLREDGFDIVVSTNTADAMERYLRDETFSLIITDLGRKENDDYDPVAGLKLAEHIRKTNDDVPIFVYATRKGIASHRRRMKELGVTEATSSPMELFELINRAVEG